MSMSSEKHACGVYTRTTNRTPNHLQTFKSSLLMDTNEEFASEILYSYNIIQFFC